MTNFTTQLDWAAFGLDGSVHNNLWTNSTTSGYNVTVSEANLGTGEGARTAANFGSVYAFGAWYDYQSSPVYVPNSFMGHFDAPSSPYTYDSSVPGDPGDHLMGLAGNGIAGSTSKSLIIDFGTSLQNFAFRIAAVNLNSFDVTVKLFDGANGTGNLLSTTTFANLIGGGNCASLRPGSGTAPTPCNDAQLIAALGALNTRSIAIQSNDPSGFYIGDILTTAAVPEPTSMILAGCGLVLLYVGKKKFGRV